MFTLTTTNTQYVFKVVGDKYLIHCYYGTGDYRCTSIKMRGKNGDSCTFFQYYDYEISKGQKDIPGMPCAREMEDTETLAIRLKDPVTGCNEHHFVMETIV